MMITNGCYGRENLNDIDSYNDVSETDAAVNTIGHKILSKSTQILTETVNLGANVISSKAFRRLFGLLALAAIVLICVLIPHLAALTVLLFFITGFCAAPDIIIIKEYGFLFWLQKILKEAHVFSKMDRIVRSNLVAPSLQNQLLEPIPIEPVELSQEQQTVESLVRLANDNPQAAKLTLQTYRTSQNPIEKEIYNRIAGLIYADDHQNWEASDRSLPEPGTAELTDTMTAVVYSAHHYGDYRIDTATPEQLVSLLKQVQDRIFS